MYEETSLISHEAISKSKHFKIQLNAPAFHPRTMARINRSIKTYVSFFILNNMKNKTEFILVSSIMHVHYTLYRSKLFTRTFKSAILEKDFEVFEKKIVFYSTPSSASEIKNNIVKLLHR